MADGTWIHNRGEIEDYFATHFQEVFQSSNPPIPPNLDNLLEPCIIREENAKLSRIPTFEEVQKVVFEMHPLKALGLDGLPGLFFRHYWSIEGEQVVAAVQSFFHDGWMLKEKNHTFITLIPKVQGACNFNQFRPISLCNVYYKIISKLLVNRLRPLLSKIIDPA